jgi:hypothetical protein
MVFYEFGSLLVEKRNFQWLSIVDINLLSYDYIYVRFDRVFLFKCEAMFSLRTF